MVTPIVIELDRPRPLIYSVAALQLVEDRSRRNLGEMLVSNASLSAAVWLIWAGLIHDDPDFKKRPRRGEPRLTVGDVADLLEEHWFNKGRTLPELSPLYTAAIVDQTKIFSRRDPEKKDSPAPGSQSPGSGSVTG